MNHKDILPYGLAILGLGVGILLITLFSLPQVSVSYSRTEWTARLALLLSLPAAVAYGLAWISQTREVHRGVESGRIVVRQ